MQTPTARDVDLDRWWSGLPTHQRVQLARLPHHPLPHTLARALLADPVASAFLELRGEGHRARWLLRPPAAEYAATRALSSRQAG